MTVLIDDTEEKMTQCLAKELIRLVCVSLESALNDCFLFCMDVRLDRARITRVR